jgi:hypothetical protein
MKRASFYITLVASLFYCCSARGQGCGVSIQAYYDVYTSVSLVQTTIHTAVTTDGYAIMNPSASCNVVGVTHQGAAYNLISTTGGWVYGPKVCVTCHITVTNNQSFNGSPGVRYPFNWQGQVICSKVGTFFSQSGGSTITDVSATITMKSVAGQTVSADDSALSNYRTATGTTSLGPILENGLAKGCGIGFETAGTLSPSTYVGTVIIHRTIVSQGLYINTAAQTPAPNFTDDTSNPGLQDENPTDSVPNGKVYDLDAPTQIPPTIGPDVYRYRTNFYTYAAIPDGTPAGIAISPQYLFYVRLSCTYNGAARSFATDVAGDNQSATGSTNLTWDLR